MGCKGRVLVYSIVGCPHCTRAKETLRQLGLPYCDVSLDMYDSRVRQQLQALSGSSSVPQIFFNERHVGGNSHLQALVADKDKLAEYISYVTDHAPPADAPQPPDPALALPSGDSLPECEPDEHSLLIQQLKQAGVIRPRRGLLSRARHCFTGSEFVQWMVENESVDEARAVEIGQELLSQHFTVQKSKTDEQTFSKSPTVYHLLEDNYSSALNAGPFQCRAGSAVEAGEGLRRLVLRLYSLFISRDGTTVDYKGMAASKEFAAYERQAGELQRVNLDSLSTNQKIAFFINVYNALVIHATVRQGAPRWAWERYKFFFRSSYIIGGMLFSLQDIENGVLRGNRRGVGMLRPPLAKTDPRVAVALGTCEPKVHFALNCGARGCPPIKTFTPDAIQEELAAATASFLEDPANLSVDPGAHRVTLSQIFQWYRADFGGASDLQVVGWVRDHVTSDVTRGQLSDVMASGRLQVKYFKYDWSHNAKD